MYTGIIRYKRAKLLRRLKRRLLALSTVILFAVAFVGLQGCAIKALAAGEQADQMADDCIKCDWSK